MIATTQVRFRNRREPFPYDFEGRTGTYYSFEALDDDDTKCQIGCSEAQWAALESCERGDLLDLVIEAKKVKVYGDGLRLAVAA